MAYPDKIDICPIIDSVVEIRFSSNIFPNAVFGLIYNALQKEFQKVEKLPILQLPEQLRDIDPQFKFKPQYKINSTDGYAVQIGSDVIIVGSVQPYPGWSDFSSRIYYVISKVVELGIIKSVSRLGIRYVNFFEENIFPNVELEIALNHDAIVPRRTLLRTEIEKEGFNNALQISNDASRKIGSEVVLGSIIDIDTNKDYIKENFLSNVRDQIEKGHLIEKSIFYGLLKPEFLAKLKPTYS